MTALAQDRAQSFERWTHHEFTLLAGTKAFKHGMAGLIIGGADGGKVVPFDDREDLFYLGTFDEQVDATTAAKRVTINFGMEIEIRWYANDGSIAADDVGKIASGVDDQTVSLDAAGRSQVGRIWWVSAGDGVAIQKLDSLAGGGGGGGGAGASLLALPAYAANDSALDEAVHGAVYDVPATAAASTITLPGDARDGVQIWISADGVKNGHTVTYRDGANANAAITTALLASKRHLVAFVFLDGTWRANAYTSP